jgi:hypothetical protein
MSKRDLNDMAKQLRKEADAVEKLAADSAAQLRMEAAKLEAIAAGKKARASA